MTTLWVFMALGQSGFQSLVPPTPQMVSDSVPASGERARDRANTEDTPSMSKTTEH